MRRKFVDTNEANRLGKLLTADETKLPQTLSAALKGQAEKSGESIFTTALKVATPDHVARAQRVTGPLDISYCIESYRRTQNPLWLWFGLSEVKGPEDIPSEVFQYLKQVAGEFRKGILDQVQSLERVQITPDREVQEGAVHLPPEPPPSPDIAEVLGLLQPSRSPFQALARDLQAVSMVVAIDDLIRRTGCSHEQAYTALAMVLGRTSSDAGPSAEVVRKIVARGRKLLPKRPTKPPR
jgi:hypothetical protein